MNRRDSLLALIALGAAPRALAQAPKGLPRVAIVDPGEQVANMVEGRHPYWGALLAELRQLGYAEGKTVVVERWSGGGETAGGYLAVARKIVGSRPHVIVSRGRTMTAPIVAATKEIPIVAVGTIPPEWRASLARPGGNVTGIHISFDQQRLYSKQAELLRDATREGARIAWFGPRPLWESIVSEAARKGAKQAKLSLNPVFVGSPVNEVSIRNAFTAIAAGKFEGLYVSPGTDLFPHRKAIAEMAAAARLPSIGLGRYYAEAGLTMGYGPDFPDVWRRAAHYVDRILKGANPGEIPIEQPSKIELVVNLKVARAAGITIPPSVLARADRVIQ